LTQQDRNAAERHRIVVVYERVSSKKQDIARQAKQREYALRDYPDYEVVVWDGGAVPTGKVVLVVADDGVPASKVPIFERPKSGPMCEWIEQDEVAAIYTDAQDRLSRGEDVEWVTFRALCEKNDTRIVIDGTEQPHDFAGRVTGYIQNLQSQAEIVEKKKRAHSKARLKAERGEYLGGKPPHGYKLRWFQDGKEMKCEPVPDPPARGTMRRIFRERLAGKAQMRIEEDLNREGVPAPGERWNQSTLSKMLRNRYYIGKVRFKDEEFDGQHEPIIDPETFYAVQRLMDAERGTKGQGRGRRSVGSHLFGNGMLRCGRCGGPMDPRTDKRRRRQTYVCRRAKHHECDAREQGQAEIDGPVLRYFADVILDVNATLAQLRATEDARREEVTEQRKQAEREQLRLNGEREHVEREFRAGLSHKRYEALCDKLDEEQEAADAQVEQLRAREAELSAESMVAAITAEQAESLSDIRAAIVEHVRGAGDLDAVRAALLPVFEKFVYVDMSGAPLPTRRLAPEERTPDEVVARGGAFLELYLRPEAIREWTLRKEHGAEWLGPVVPDDVSLESATPLSMRANNQSSGSPSSYASGSNRAMRPRPRQ
jgi:DNA invertase Pin-like site-specific DNA recombinase